MALRLTHENLPAAYEYLRACEPFCRWKLPHADELEFRVTRHGDRFGHFRAEKGGKWPEFSVSENMVTTTALLLETLGHEMIHLKEHVDGVKWRGGDHGPQFLRVARSVCRIHGFDLEAFV